MVEALKTSIRSVYQRSYVQIFEEVSLGYGIADIVVSDVRTVEPKDLSYHPILTKLDINLYWLILDARQSTTDEIIKITRCSRSTIKKSLDKLKQCDYIIEDDEKFQINKCYQLQFRNNFAVEAKLKDWKRALKQAYRYKWFAEYSFVVLDTHHSKSALNNISEFRKYNVGLASISPDGSLIRHFNPKRQKPFDMKMQILFSEKVKNQTFRK